MRHNPDINKIRAISFDADMTLWDFRKVMRHSLNIVLKKLEKLFGKDRLASLSVDKMIDIRNRAAEELKGKTTNLEQIRLHAFIRTTEYIGEKDIDLAERLNALYLKHRFEDIELYDDVINSFSNILSKYALGLISNGNSYPEKCGLDGKFSFVVFSQYAGVVKPDAGIFRIACRKAGCSPDELIHVGDSLIDDVDGANRFGAVSVWLNRDKLGNNTDILPEFEIHSLNELVQHIMI